MPYFAVFEIAVYLIPARLGEKREILLGAVCSDGAAGEKRLCFPLGGRLCAHDLSLKEGPAFPKRIVGITKRLSADVLAGRDITILSDGFHNVSFSPSLGMVPDHEEPDRVGSGAIGTMYCWIPVKLDGEGAFPGMLWKTNADLTFADDPPRNRQFDGKDLCAGVGLVQRQIGRMSLLLGIRLFYEIAETPAG